MMTPPDPFEKALDEVVPDLYDKGSQHKQNYDNQEDTLKEAKQALLAAHNKAIDKAIDETASHLYSASQMRYALDRVFRTKTSPEMIAVILEDLADELAALKLNPPEAKP